jgi:hypothetical protein
MDGHGAILGGLFVQMNVSSRVGQEGITAEQKNYDF